MKLNNYKYLAMFLATFVTANAHAEEAANPLSFDISTGVYSDYMFRGQNLYDGTLIQPNVGVNYDFGDAGKVSAIFSMYLPGEGDRQAEKFTEIDNTLMYTLAIDKLTVKAGHVWYSYPDDDDDIKDTSEFFATLAFDDSEVSPFALNPSLTVYKDYREIEYWYYELGFSHEIATDVLGKGFSTTPYVTFGFASNADVVYEDDGLEQVTVGTAFNLAAGDLNIVPTVNYTFEVDDNTVNEFWIGTSFAFSL